MSRRDTDENRVGSDHGMEPSPYERRVRAEIERWQDEKDGVLTKALNVAGLPVGWAYERIPDAGRKTVERAVLGFMEMLRDGSRWTYPDGGVVEGARKVGIEVDDYRDLRHHDLEKLDRLARSGSWLKITNWPAWRLKTTT